MYIMSIQQKENKFVIKSGLLGGTAKRMSTGNKTNTTEEESFTVITVPLDLEDAGREKVLRKYMTEFFTYGHDDRRATYDRFVSLTPNVAIVSFESVSAGGIGGWWCKPPNVPTDRAILYLHGGAYALGTASAYRGLGSQIASRTGLAVFVLNYPLAPEAKLPVAYELALDAMQWLLRQGFRRIAVAGDSAGGGLALASVAHAMKCQLFHGNPFPAITACVLFSPWTDLSFSGSTITFADPVLSLDTLREDALQYLGKFRADDCRASPLFGMPTRMPPAYIQVGSDEMLLDDSRRYAKRSAAAGNEVKFEVWQGMHHVFQMSTAELASSRKALDCASQFLTASFGGQ